MQGLGYRGLEKKGGGFGVCDWERVCGFGVLGSRVLLIFGFRGRV